MRNNRGFSLIEVLVIIVLVGVLSGIAIAQYASFRSRGVDSKIAAVVRGVATSEEAFYAANRFYTANVSDLNGLSIGDVTIAVSPGNSGSLATSFRVAGSHAGTARTFTWLSDPLPGEPNLIEGNGAAAGE
jgi:prepilin-type N-terminal cleavage/methylation domain-containing protein